MNISYDKTKSLTHNVLEAFKFLNWVCREMQDGRVDIARQDITQNTNDILQAQADFVEAVVDEYNAIIEG